MNEKILHFVWQMKLFDALSLKTIEGAPVIIGSTGALNKNAGPDLLNARIKIGDTNWAGHIEMHVRSSDWDRHDHSSDSGYDNVIAHVVWIDDKPISKDIPTIELQGRVSRTTLVQIDSFFHSPHKIPCHAHIASVSRLVIKNWTDRLIAERLEQKAAHILDILQQNNNSWEETCWVVTARNFGLPVNGDAFEEIARSVPLKWLSRSKNQLIQLEALLLGQAGILRGEFTDKYALMLRKEYQYLRQKYSLQVPFIQVKFLRMRPANFPSIRLAQLAALIYESRQLFSKILEASTASEIIKLFEVNANDYWNNHYRPNDEPHESAIKSTGKDFIHNLLINAVVPMLYAYGLYHKNDMYRERALHFLEAIPGENNSITRIFKSYGIASREAYTSQSLIHLFKNYCTPRQCLQCAIGVQILKGA